MLFARDKSQMCNNLLQYAHVYAWGREHGRDTLSMRFSYKYKYFKISHTRFVSFPLYLFAKYAAALGILPTASFKSADCNIQKLEEKMLRNKHIVVSGWFARWYELFIKYRSEITDLFTIDYHYTSSVKKEMCDLERHSENVVRLGVHIRRGDYATWKDGLYYYTDETYIAYIRRFVKLCEGCSVHVYLSTNDFSVDAANYGAMVPEAIVHLLRGTAIEDLYMLSECDYIIGPPSTFSLVAAMYRDIPLCRMDTVKAENLTKESFYLFDYWFRRIV